MREDFDRKNFLTPKETAKFLRVTVDWLQRQRMRKCGPPYLKIGHFIYYPEQALLDWLAKQEVKTDSN